MNEHIPGGRAGDWLSWHFDILAQGANLQNSKTPLRSPTPIPPFSQKSQFPQGTPYYLSPEICTERLYSFASDMWALGCVLFELTALHVPFEAQHIARLASCISFDSEPPSLGLRQYEGIHLSSLLLSVQKWPCLRTAARLYEYVVLYWYNLILYDYVLWFVLCPYALLLWACPPVLQKSEVYGTLKKTRNGLWSPVVQFSRRDLCFRVVWCRALCFLWCLRFGTPLFLRTTFSHNRKAPYYNVKNMTKAITCAAQHTCTFDVQKSGDVVDTLWHMYVFNQANHYGVALYLRECVCLLRILECMSVSMLCISFVNWAGICTCMLFCSLRVLAC